MKTDCNEENKYGTDVEQWAHVHIYEDQAINVVT